MSLQEKMDNIFNIIGEIKEIDPGVAAILIEGFGLSLNLIKEVAENGRRKEIDISEHIEIVSNVLGISMKDLVLNIIQSQQPADGSSKEADKATLDFITSDLDDYEKFLAQNKAKEDLDFLSKSI